MIKKLIKGATGFFAVLGMLVLVGGGDTVGATATPVHGNISADALKRLHFQHVQFSATGFPTFYDDNFTDPPQLLQKFTLEENLHTLPDPNSPVIGTSHIECTITGLPSPTSIQFSCKGSFAFTNGATLPNVLTQFTFDFTNLPAQYDAYILGGTGAYKGALGVIHVTDPGPGNPTGYVFDFYTL